MVLPFIHTKKHGTDTEPSMDTDSRELIVSQNDVIDGIEHNATTHTTPHVIRIVLNEYDPVTARGTLTPDYTRESPRETPTSTATIETVPPEAFLEIPSLKTPPTIRETVTRTRRDAIIKTTHEREINHWRNLVRDNLTSTITSNDDEYTVTYTTRSPDTPTPPPPIVNEF